MSFFAASRGKTVTPLRNPLTASSLVPTHKGERERTAFCEIDKQDS
jgi:hypothetical protein